jgi:hypothetical protein
MSTLIICDAVSHRGGIRENYAVMNMEYFNNDEILHVIDQYLAITYIHLRSGCCERLSCSKYLIGRFYNPIMGRELNDAGSKYGASTLEVSQAREIMESQRSRTC